MSLAQRQADLNMKMGIVRILTFQITGHFPLKIILYDIWNQLRLISMLLLSLHHIALCSFPVGLG